MNMVKNSFFCIGIMLNTIVFIAGPMANADEKKYMYHESGQLKLSEKEGKTRQINWETKYVVAKGMGISNAENPAQKKVLARRVAIVDAQRNLLEMIRGIQLDSKTIISDISELSEVIQSQINGTLKDAEVIDENWNEGVYEVTMRAPVGKLIHTLLKETKKNADSKALSFPKISYSGIVIDARGLKLTPSILVNIYNENGEKICGPVHPVYRVSTKDLLSIKLEDTGNNPLKITAGNIREGNNTDLIIANEDALKISEMMANTDILTIDKSLTILID
ncbi:MAG: hypothetical protein E3K37_03620 [Candidatus Kuenenia sp.]|nr:hypothetical protein [Candidatus Kuenenia hertensis]